MLATAAAIVSAALVLGACKSKRASEGDESGATATSARTGARESGTSSSPESYRPDDGTAAGNALAVLAAIEVPSLEGDPACAEYARNTRTLFTDLGYQLRHLRARAKSGLSRQELGGLVEWLDARGGMLEAMARARSMPEGELGRVHLEVAGSVMDLANAFGMAYGQEGEPGQEDAVRLGNAAENFAAAIAALGAQCNGTHTQSQ